MKTKHLMKAGIAILLGYAMNACTADQVQSDICFESEIFPIFQNNCNGCHNDNSAEAGYNFTTHAGILEAVTIGNPNNSELIEVITETDASELMPPAPAAPLSSAEIDLLSEWILAGAENTTGCADTTIAPTCDTLNRSYSQDIAPIFNDYCTVCHNTASPSAGYDLSTHSGVVAALNTNRLLGSIRHDSGFSPMPQGGGKMTDCEIEQLEAWVNAGAQDN